jgi:hypothetical protein
MWFVMNCARYCLVVPRMILVSSDGQHSNSIYCCRSDCRLYALRQVSTLRLFHATTLLPRHTILRTETYSPASSLLPHLSIKPSSRNYNHVSRLSPHLSRVRHRQDRGARRRRQGQQGGHRTGRSADVSTHQHSFPLTNDPLQSSDYFPALRARRLASIVTKTKPLTSRSKLCRECSPENQELTVLMQHYRQHQVNLFFRQTHAHDFPQEQSVHQRPRGQHFHREMMEWLQNDHWVYLRRSVGLQRNIR